MVSVLMSVPSGMHRGLLRASQTLHLVAKTLLPNRRHFNDCTVPGHPETRPDKLMLSSAVARQAQSFYAHLSFSSL